MRKKCIAIAKKAMVWTLAASMLVATPLTASAAGLRDVYKVEDGWGNPVGDPADDDTRTGTVSATGSNSGVLNNESKILGITLDQSDVKMVLRGSYPKYKDSKQLKASLIFAEGVDDATKSKITEDLADAFRWESEDRDVVTATKKDNPNGDTNVVTLNAKAGGNVKVTVSLDRDYKGEDIHFEATANVFVKQYVDSLEFNTEKGNQLINHTLKIEDAFVKSPDTANEEIVYDIEEQKDSSNRTVKNIATLKNGVLTFKKEGTVKVIAVTENNTKVEGTIKVTEGNPAKTIKVIKKGDTADKPKNKGDLDTATMDKFELEAVLTPKYSVDAKGPCTDEVVSWTAKKDGIVTIKKIDGLHAELAPVTVGQTQITALTSNGKKGTFTINVKATLAGLKITTENQTLWSGQTLQFGVDKIYKNAAKNIGNDKLKWYIVNNSDVKKYASINATTGVLTIKTTVDESKTIKVAVKSSKKIGSDYVMSADPEYVEIAMKQASVDKIVVYENEPKENEPIIHFANAGYDKKNTKKGQLKLAAGKSKTYNVVAYDAEGNDTITYKEGNKSKTIPLAATLNWSSSKTKIATVSKVSDTAGMVKADKDGKGKSTITVSGVKGTTNGSKTTYKSLKATFTADVTRPTRTITLTSKTQTLKAAADVDKRKAQNISFSAKLDTKTTSKTANIQWKVEQRDINGQVKSPCVASINKGKLSVPKKANGYAPGDQFIVTATLKDPYDRSSVTAKAIVNVVSESYAVQIQNSALLTPTVFDRNKTELAVGATQEIGVMVDIGVKNSPDLQRPNAEIVKEGKVVAKAADVTLTVNKKGIVQIKDNDDGTYTVYRIKKGAVKITATTSDGKKTTLSVADPK